MNNDTEWVYDPLKGIVEFLTDAPPLEKEEHVQYLLASDMLTPKRGGEKMDSEELFDEKLGRAEDRWQHATELHNQKIDLMFEKFDERMKRSDEKFDERMKHSEELNRVLIKNIGDNTDRIVKSLSERTDRIEIKMDRIETKMDRIETKMEDNTKEIKSSNRTTLLAVLGLVITVLIAILKS
jgi:hypothetical protein